MTCKRIADVQVALTDENPEIFSYSRNTNKQPLSQDRALCFLHDDRPSCTCNTECDCNSECSCDDHCSCDSECNHCYCHDHVPDCSCDVTCPCDDKDYFPCASM